jgi:CDP-diacylglycerol---serine O-phosphatidyltransferase
LVIGHFDLMPTDHDQSDQPFRRRRRRRRLRPSRMLRVLPSLFTLGNLLCGFAAIFYAFRYPGRENALEIAAALVFVGMVFDALDGRIARLTRQTSQMGEQLDSMADLATFGLAPAFLVINLVEIGTPFFGEAHPFWGRYFERFVLVVTAVYAACTALRLARFNAELEQPGEADHMSFKGLPSPAAAGTVASLVLLQQLLLGRQPPDADIPLFRDPAKLTAIGLVLITLLTAVAMVSTMRYVHVMNRYMRDRAPIHYVGAAVFVLIPLLTVPQFTLSIIFVAYALSAPGMLLLRRGRGLGQAPTGAPGISGEVVKW